MDYKDSNDDVSCSPPFAGPLPLRLRSGRTRHSLCYILASESIGMGVLNEKIIGNLHVYVRDDGQGHRFTRGTSCRISGSLVLDTSDASRKTFDSLHFMPLSLLVQTATSSSPSTGPSASSWNAVPFQQSIGCVPSNRKLAKMKAIPARLGPWRIVASPQPSLDVPAAYAMDFFLDIPDAFFVAQAGGRFSWLRSCVGVAGRDGAIVGIELSAEIRVTRLRSSSKVPKENGREREREKRRLREESNDYAWRQRDKILWAWSVPKDRHWPRWLQFVSCGL